MARNVPGSGALVEILPDRYYGLALPALCWWFVTGATTFVGVVLQSAGSMHQNVEERVLPRRRSLTSENFAPEPIVQQAAVGAGEQTPH